VGQGLAAWLEREHAAMLAAEGKEVRALKKRMDDTGKEKRPPRPRAVT
jgi:hypothetical protein